MGVGEVWGVGGGVCGGGARYVGKGRVSLSVCVAVGAGKIMSGRVWGMG